MKRLGRGIQGLLCLSFAALGIPPLHGQNLPFTTLDPAYTQELFAVAPPGGFNLGGLGFAPDGDVWAKPCGNASAPLRFDLGSSVTVNGTKIHPQVLPPASGIALGCGMTNHPDGQLYVNTPTGTARINSSTGVLMGMVGPPGSIYGIAVDPQTNRLVYASAACAGNINCTLVTVDPSIGDSQNLGTFTAGGVLEFVDGITFDPTGAFIIVSGRTGVFPNDTPYLTILTRSGTVVRQLPADRFPDTVSFHQNPFYLVANNNDGTITRYDFPGDDLRQTAVPSVIASGGFRGDLTAVGNDGCLYVTQAGTRYANGISTTDNSIVRICSTSGAFVPSSPTPRTISHIANGAGFRTTVILINTGPLAAYFTVRFVADGGTPLTLPLGTDGTASELSGVIQPGVARFIQTTGAGVDLQKGWAELTAPSNVDGNSVFGAQTPGQGESEAAVPLSPAGGSVLYLPFDNTPGNTTGVALAAPGQQATVSGSFLDDSGSPLPDTHTVTVPAHGHYSDVLANPFLATQQKRGAARFTATSNIFGLGIRANGRAFTSIDALSGVTAAAKTIAHIADGGGWRMTFLLVNTGTQPANFTLKFWDDNGDTLPLPLGADGTTSSLTRTIQPGALRVVQTSGTASQLATGWAELSATGPIGGTSIFGLQSAGQSDSEAAAPFSLAGSMQLYMPYDFTPGHATGMAFTNPNPNQDATVTMSFTDDAGHILATGRIVRVPAHGHLSKVLADLFPDIVGTRGTVSLSSNTPIFGLGIRSNGLAFTSLKVIAK